MAFCDTQPQDGEPALCLSLSLALSLAPSFAPVSALPTCALVLSSLFVSDDELLPAAAEGEEADIMETDVWGSDTAGAAAHANRKRKARTDDTKILAQHCEKNIPHKTARGVFVPSPMLGHLLERVRLVGS